MILDIQAKLNYTKADKTLDAQGKAYEILRKLLPDWTNGKLKTGATTSLVQTFIDTLYSAVCLGDAPSLTSGGGAGVITPAGGGLVVTSDKQAGVFFPAGAVTVNTTVTIAPSSTPLNTKLDQYLPIYVFTATPHDPASPFGADLTVGICLDPTIDATVFGRLKLAHNIADGYFTTNRFGKIEIMPTATTSALGLSCPTFTGPLGSASTLDRWKSYAAALFLPEPLQATSAALTGLGGTTRVLSPFAAVDPQIQLSINAGDGQTAVVGTNVAVAPSVLAKTNLGTKVPGVPVAFAVTAGGGTISPTTTVPTDVNGVAAATSWTLGTNAGANTATGAGQAISQLTYLPTSVTFNATGVTTKTIGYGATDWKYILIGSTPPSNSTTDYPGSTWYTPAFPGTAWLPAAAPFGSSPSAGCTVFNTNPPAVANSWPAAVSGTIADSASGSSILLRNTFTATAGSSLVVEAAIDNDLQVFIDGHNVTNGLGVVFTANANTDAGVAGFWNNPSYVNGFRAHGGCAQRGDGAFSIPGSFLNADGIHTIAVYARDYGGAAYVDVKVTVLPPVILR